MKRLAIVLAVFLLLLGCQKSKAPEEVAMPGAKAPSFTLRGLDGRPISLDALKGKVVLIEFWATWCPPCRASIPELEALYKEFLGKDFELIGISIDDPEAREDVKRFVKEYNMPYPVAIDDGRVSKVYGVVSIPTLYILDRDHKIVKHYFGYSRGLKDTLASEIRALLKKDV